MLIFPTIMNAIQYWIIDTFIKGKTSPSDQSQHTDSQDESRQPLRRGSMDSDDGDSDASSVDVDEPKTRRRSPIRITKEGLAKEANAASVLVEDGSKSSGSSASRSRRRSRDEGN